MADGPIQGDAPTQDAPTPGEGGGGAYGGRVVLEEADQGTTLFFASASFSLAADRVVLEGCSGVPLTSGSCCFLPRAPSSGGVSAGAITIADKGSPIGQLSFGAQGYATAMNPPTTGLTWAAGDTLQVAAAGDAVGAFSGAVAAPQTPVLINSPGPAGGALPLSLSQGSMMSTPFSWTPAGPVGAKVLLILTDDATGELKCLADDAAGHIVVPSQSIPGNFHVNDTGYLEIGRLVVTQAAQDPQVEVVSFAAIVWTVQYMQ